MSININITSSTDKLIANAKASGSLKHIITDKERKTFQLGGKNLKDAVKKYFGKKPGQAWLHGPTPMENRVKDLYKHYGWEEVQVVLEPVEAKVLSVNSKPEIIETQELKNESSKKGTFKAEISQSVNNTTESSWTTGGAFSIKQKISYGINFEGIGVSGETSFSYSKSWGEGGKKSTSVTLGSSSGLDVELLPNESVLVKLSANRGTMKVRVTYNAYLIGCTAVNYNPPHKGHHFWPLPIGKVMSKAGIPNAIKSTEDIEIGFYGNTEVELKDKKSGKLKATYSIADTPAINSAMSVDAPLN